MTTNSSRSHARVIVNPVAGAGSAGKKWPGIRDLLTQSGLAFDHVVTEDSGHAIELANEAVVAGYKMVVAVGGDGTLNEVVNGLVDSGNTDEVTMGILNTGSGCDFARFLGVPRDHRSACLRLVNPRKVTVDIGVAEYQSKGQSVQRYFLNAAGLGFDGEVVEAVAKSPKVFRGTVPYVLGLLRSLAVYRNKDICMEIDNDSRDMRICTVVIANGGFFGGGMHVAPEADSNDGLFEVMVVSDIGKLELLRAFPSIYRGTHLTHPKVWMGRASQITIRSSERVLVQADGDLLGEAPATFRILPSALSVAV